MLCKLRGTITPPRYRKKKIGDIEKMVGRFEFEFLRNENRKVSTDELLDLTEQVDCVITIELLGKEQLEFFDRQDADLRLAELEADEKLQENKKALALLKKLKADDARDKLEATAFISRVNEIYRLVHPAPEATQKSGKTDQRQRLEELQYSEDVNRTAEAQRLITRIESDDKARKLTDEELEKRLDEVEAAVKKHNNPKRKRKTTSPIDQPGAFPGMAS